MRLGLQESSDLNTKMVLPDAFAVRVPCIKCKKAKKGLLSVCIVVVCVWKRCMQYAVCRL